MKTILVPADFSKEAKSALWYALDMSLVSKANLVLLHVFHHPIFAVFPYDDEAMQLELETKKLQKLRAFAKKALDSFCNYYSLVSGTSVRAHAKEIRASGNGFAIYLDDERVFSVALACHYGLTEAGIVRAASKHKADLVVMGMRGAGAISQALLGSTSLGVIEKCEVPVLAVPLQARFNGMASVVMAIDPFKMPAADALLPLQQFAATFNSEVAVLQLYGHMAAQEERERKLRSCNLLKQYLTHTKYKLYAGTGEDVAAGIEQFLEAKQADLLVLLPQKHSFLSRLRNKSITGQMAARANVPLLALPCAAATVGVSQPQHVFA